ncbi:hypothetical protein ABZ434_25940 [Streptomyces sp. NPDC005761]|uniref:hypothetical protein n=1 Tax=unclassified Streptomyces TaxID=2593676 RepID=UPI00340282A7
MSEVEVILSTPLARFADGETKFRVPAGTIPQVLGKVFERHPALRLRVADGLGAVLPFVSVYVGEDNIRDLETPDAAVAPHSTVMIMSAVAGG